MSKGRLVEAEPMLIIIGETSNFLDVLSAWFMARHKGRHKDLGSTNTSIESCKSRDWLNIKGVRGRHDWRWIHILPDLSILSGCQPTADIG